METEKDQIGIGFKSITFMTYLPSPSLASSSFSHLLKAISHQYASFEGLPHVEDEENEE